jgi:hypothetical protein
VLGQPIRQSDIIEAIDATEGVSYVVVPLTKMAVADGALIPQETITTDQTTDYFKVTDWSDTSTYSDVYLLLEQLSCGTLNSGGYVYDPRGVFYNENLLTNLDTMPDAYGVPLVNAPYITFIIGNGGMIIPGYSDDTTLKTKYPFATDREIVDKRIEITSRRVLVSLPKNTTPLDALWWVSYVVYADTGVKNIEPGSLGYVTINNLEFTYAADTETTLTRYI